MAVSISGWMIQRRLRRPLLLEPRKVGIKTLKGFFNAGEEDKLDMDLALPWIGLGRLLVTRISESEGIQGIF
jgi:hypothetical protein